MRVTRQIGERLYNNGLVAKKKHKHPSITKEEFFEWLNMVNVLNMVQRDETMICGFLISKYLMNQELVDMIMPLEVNISGNSKGANLMSDEYKTYSPWQAKFINKADYSAECGDQFVRFDELVRQSSPAVKEVGNFRIWLTPDEFNTLGAMIYATFKVVASDSKFTSVGDLKKYESLDKAGDRLNMDDEYVRYTASDYWPIKSKVNFYQTNQYFYERDDMVIDWFKAACDVMMTKQG